MQKQILLLRESSILMAGASVIVFTCMLWLVEQRNMQATGNQVVEPPQSFCGVIESAENSFALLEHPGRILFKDNCEQCHALSGEIVVGPGLYRVTDRISPKTFQLLLYRDSQKRLPRLNYYKRLKRQYGTDFHENLKFDFNDSMKVQLKAFMDTVNVMQEPLSY